MQDPYPRIKTQQKKTKIQYDTLHRNTVRNKIKEEARMI